MDRGIGQNGLDIGQNGAAFGRSGAGRFARILPARELGGPAIRGGTTRLQRQGRGRNLDGRQALARRLSPWLRPLLVLIGCLGSVGAGYAAAGTSALPTRRAAPSTGPGWERSSRTRPASAFSRCGSMPAKNGCGSTFRSAASGLPAHGRPGLCWTAIGSRSTCIPKTTPIARQRIGISTCRGPADKSPVRSSVARPAVRDRDRAAFRCTCSGPWISS